MRILRSVLAIFCIATSVAAAQDRSSKFGPSAVWQATPQFLAMAPAACKTAKSSDCLIGQMAKAGAPADAVSFSRELSKHSHGEFGIMTGYQNQAPVAFAWVNYPLRATNNYGLLLVNGKPPMVNVEDLSLLDTKTMRQSFQFQDLKNQFPKVDVFPGDRDGQTWPNSQSGPSGGTQFVVGYPLRDGCPTCSHAGFALFSWNFDAKGKFLGTTFLGMTPAPLH